MIKIKLLRRDSSLFHLKIEVPCVLLGWVFSVDLQLRTQLSFDVVKTANIQGESTLEGTDIFIELDELTRE